MAAAADIAVVIVTYNSRTHIGACVESLRAQAGVETEIVVVDNASRDGTAAQVREASPEVRLIARNNNGGLSAAINEGVAATAAPYVLSLNPDTRVEAGALDAIAAYLSAHDDAGVVGPKLLNDDGSLQLSCRAFPGYATSIFNRYSPLTRLLPRNRFSRRYLMTGFSHDEVRDVDWVSGAAFAFPRAVFDRIGGMDAGYFMFSEDVDFCRRVHDAGYRVAYLPQARVVHEIGASRRSVPARMVIERHRSMWRYYRKHMRGGRLRDAVTAAGIGMRCAALLAVEGVRRVAGGGISRLRREDALP